MSFVAAVVVQRNKPVVVSMKHVLTTRGNSVENWSQKHETIELNLLKFVDHGKIVGQKLGQDPAWSDNLLEIDMNQRNPSHENRLASVLQLWEHCEKTTCISVVESFRLQTSFYHHWCGNGMVFGEYSFFSWFSSVLYLPECWNLDPLGMGQRWSSKGPTTYIDGLKPMACPWKSWKFNHFSDLPKAGPWNI